MMVAALAEVTADWMVGMTVEQWGERWAAQTVEYLAAQRVEWLADVKVAMKVGLMVA